MFSPELYIEKGAIIKGQFQNGENSNIFIESSFDTIKYNNYRFSSNTVDLNFSKHHLSQDVLGIGFISSQSQQLNSNLNTENLNHGALLDWQEK